MPSARDQMQMLKGELDRVKREIERLKVEEALLVKMLAKMGDGTVHKARRARSPAVKPAVLNIMEDVGSDGATTSEVERGVRERVPTVAKDTVGSVLSRLKADGALTYAGDRYYVKGKEPHGNDPKSPDLRMVR